MPSPVPDSHPPKHPGNLLAWLSLDCSALAVFSTSIVMVTARLLHAGMSWLSWYSVGQNLLVMLALGLALLARDRAPRAMWVGVALGASGVLALSAILSWVATAIAHLY